jgi:hypothetical protein
MHAVTNQYGLVIFPADELSVNTWYTYKVAWPIGYHGPEDPNDSHFWGGEIYPARIYGFEN